MKRLKEQTAETTAPERKSGPAPSAGSQEKSANSLHSSDPEFGTKERGNASLAAFRLLAKNYELFGSESDAQKAYAFDQRQRLKYQPTFVRSLIWVTTNFGANNEWLAYWFLGLWIIPWALGYWRPGIIVSADPKAEPPDDSLSNWVSALGEDPSRRQLHMIGFSLWFSFHTLVPGIQVFGFDKWAPSHQKICEVIPMRYTSLATIQRILGWILLPIAIAAFAGLFRIK